jgi:hypothetical protein
MALTSLALVNTAQITFNSLQNILQQPLFQAYFDALPITTLPMWAKSHRFLTVDRQIFCVP